MQATSSVWNPYADEITPNAAVQFELIDVDAAEVASAAANVAGLSFTDITQTHDEITQNSLKLATLAPDQWKLDGTWILPRKEKTNGETGWWSSAQSNAAGNFTVNPILTYTFNTPQSSDGFTIVFDTKAEEVAADFTVSTYDASGTLIAGAAVSGNTDVIRIVECPSLNYSKITVTFTRTAKPYRRVRVTEVVFGYLQQFTKDKIVNMKITWESALYMQNLATSKLSVTIDNSDKAYNVLNPEGIYKFLQQGQGINTMLALNGESINMGRYYFESATANDDALTATITAYDLLYRLDQGKCNIGATGTWTVAEAVAAVIADSGEEIKTDIPAAIGARVIRKCIPPDTTHREALRLIAQAAMMHIYIDRLDRLTAKDIDFGQSVDELTADTMTTWGNAKDTGLINKVTVEVADEYAGGDPIIYTATNQQAGEPLQLLEISNPLANSQEVAKWILKLVGNRNQYTITSQGNPARDLADCVSIESVYGTHDKAAVIKQEINLSGSLLDSITAYGGGSV